MYKLEKGKHYKVEGYNGIAFYFRGMQEVDDEDTEWTGMRVHTGMAEMVMVGDDRVHIIDPEDIEEIDEEAFCRECGQIGCPHNVYS